MSTELLNELYKEYNLLQGKMKKVVDLIIQYGGQIPIVNTDIVYNIDGIPMSEAYFPYKGTLEDKIIYVVKNAKNAITANEIKDTIINTEGLIKLPHSHRTNLEYVAQYCSRLLKEGKIKAHRDSFQYKYYIE